MISVMPNLAAICLFMSPSATCVNTSRSREVRESNRIRSSETAVCTENLNPEVVVMESAEDGARLYASGPLNRANSRRVFVQ